MPFIPKKNPKIGQWVYLKTPVVVAEGTFTTGTRVLILSRVDDMFDFRDEYGNLGGLAPEEFFTTEMPT